MSDSKQNSIAIKLSEIKMIWNHFLKIIKRFSYVKIIMTICWYEICATNWFEIMINFICIVATIQQFDWLINNIVDVEQDEIDDKNVEFEKFEILFASTICDVFDFWLIEMKIRMSNSNRLRKFLFWTNWIQLNQRLKFNWSTRRTQRKYFCLYAFQILFKWFFCSFVKVWFFCCIATFAQNIFFESIKMMFLNVWKKMLLIWREKRLLEEFSNQKLNFVILNYWWFLMFDDSILKLI